MELAVDLESALAQLHPRNHWSHNHPLSIRQFHPSTNMHCHLLGRKSNQHTLHASGTRRSKRFRLEWRSKMNPCCDHCCSWRDCRRKHLQIHTGAEARGLVAAKVLDLALAMSHSLCHLSHNRQCASRRLGLSTSIDCHSMVYESNPRNLQPVGTNCSTPPGCWRYAQKTPYCGHHCSYLDYTNIHLNYHTGEVETAWAPASGSDQVAQVGWVLELGPNP